MRLGLRRRASNTHWWGRNGELHTGSCKNGAAGAREARVTAAGAEQDVRQFKALAIIIAAVVDGFAMDEAGVEDLRARGRLPTIFKTVPFQTSWSGSAPRAR